MKRKRLHTIVETELCRIVGLSTARLRELAGRAQLPFRWSTGVGLEIKSDELPAWMIASKRKIDPMSAQRKRLSQKTVIDILDGYWEVDEATGKHRGKVPRDYLYRNDTEAWLRFMGQYLPRELIIENSLTELADDELDDMLARLRERVEQQRAIEAKPIVRLVSGTGRSRDPAHRALKKAKETRKAAATDFQIYAENFCTSVLSRA
jgi:hypothetical protein